MSGRWALVRVLVLLVGMFLPLVLGPLLLPAAPPDRQSAVWYGIVGGVLWLGMLIGLDTAIRSLARRATRPAVTWRPHGSGWPL
jgi:hypothetical protein